MRLSSQDHIFGGIASACFLICMSWAQAANAAVTVVDNNAHIPGDTNGTFNFDFEVTGGEILVALTAFDAKVDSVLDGTVTLTYGGTSMSPVVTSFRNDGEVGSAIFVLVAPPVGMASLAVAYGTNVPITNGLARLGGVTLTGVNLTNTFGPSAVNVDLSTGITLNNIQADNVTLYSIGAQQGLGGVPPGPLLVNGNSADTEPGFFDIIRSTTAGTGALIGGLTQQSLGSVSFTHPQTAREAAAACVEVNAAGVPVELMRFSVE